MLILWLISQLTQLSFSALCSMTSFFKSFLMFWQRRLHCFFSYVSWSIVFMYWDMLPCRTDMYGSHGVTSLYLPQWEPHIMEQVFTLQTYWIYPVLIQSGNLNVAKRAHLWCSACTVGWARWFSNPGTDRGGFLFSKVSKLIVGPTKPPIQ